jgi:hypothetical protein
MNYSPASGENQSLTAADGPSRAGYSHVARPIRRPWTVLAKAKVFRTLQEDGVRILDKRLD